MSKSQERLSPKQAEEEAMAVRIMAETAALRKESLSRPESRHYEEYSQNIDQIRREDPGLADRLIRTAINGGKIEERIGSELSSLFNEVGGEVMDRMITKDFDLDKAREDSFKGFFEGLEKQIRSDKRIIQAFEGKEELLNESIKFIKQEIPYIIKAIFEAYS